MRRFSVKLASFCLFAQSLLLASPEAKAQYRDQYESLWLSSTSFTLSQYESRTFNLPYNEWRYVQKIYVQASGYCNGGTFEVLANGDVKGTVYVPGTDPTYVVTIGETINSLRLRHVSGCSVRVDSIRAVAVERPVLIPAPQPPVTPGIAFPYYTEAAGYARQAITLVDQLEGYSNYAEYGVYLLPIKKSAGLAYAAAAARGPIGRHVFDLLVALKAQIDFATPYLDETFERDRAFELAVQLKSLGEKLNMILQ